MRRSRALLVLLLASCGESPAPPAPAPVKDMKAAPAPEPKPPAEAKPAAKKAPVDKKGRAKSPELFRKYMAIMEENGELLQSIEEDVGKSRGEGAVKPKILKIVANAEAARALHYRKNPDEDVELDSDFEIFLLKMKKLRETTWDADNGKELYEDLASRCTNCHVKFQ